MAVISQSDCVSKTVYLRSGLEAKELEVELMKNSRVSDVARRTLAFYLDDMQSRGLHQALGFASAVQFACLRLSMSRRQARHYLSVGASLKDLPQIDQVFGKGDLSWSKVRLLVNVATPQNEEAWIERALQVSCQVLEEETRGAPKGSSPRQNGKGTPSVRFAFNTKLAPVENELLQVARRLIQEEEGGELSDDELLISLVEYRLRHHGSEIKSKDSLFRVSVGQCSHCAKTHLNTEDGPIELSEEKSAAITCDAAQVGDSKASPTPPALRRRVLARDGNRCFHCSSAVNLHAHHIVFRSKGGKTEISNLVTTCAHCHGMIHDGFLHVSGQAPHDLTFTDRDGCEITEPKPRLGVPLVLDQVAHVGHGPCGPPENSRAQGSKLSELIGQKDVIASLDIACRAAKVEDRPVRHILLCGPPGLGKTTMARAVAVESGVPFIEKVGPAIQCVEDLYVPSGGVSCSSTKFTDCQGQSPRSSTTPWIRRTSASLEPRPILT